jgi:hypothetical protein
MRVQRVKLAVAARLGIVLTILICFFEAPIVELVLQGRQVDCYGWRAMYRGSSLDQQRGMTACVDFLSEINRNGGAAVTIKPDVAASGELSSVAFLIAVLTVPMADLLTVAIVAAARHSAAKNTSVATETWILFLASVASFLRLVGVLVVYIGIHASATLRKEMANADAFVGVDSQMGPGAYLIAIFTLVSFAIPPMYGA